MKYLTSLLCLLTSHMLISQRMELTFGAISPDEIEMTSYEKDEEAKAVVLYDKGESVFFDTDKGYDIRFKRHKRIKIFDKSGSKEAEISIPYYVDGYGKTEVVKSIEAITYNVENGRLLKKRLDPSSIYEERINQRWMNKKFVFPDVQDGSILEYRYVLETPFHFNLPDWTFQSKIPTIYSEYQVQMIPFYEYEFIVQGVTKFDYQQSEIAKKKRTFGTVAKAYGQNVGNGVEFQDYIHTYALKDVPAFKDESYITSINDYITKMDFQLAKFHSPQGGTSDIISTWFHLNEELLKHEKFGKYLKNSSRIAKKVLTEEIDLAGLQNQEKAKKIIEYVKNSFEWNGYYGKYATQSSRSFFEQKSGNSGDINLFLVALLREAGIDAQPLILSTRNNGKIRIEYPFNHFTNYVIALVNTNSLFLADGTEEFLYYNKIPTRCFNELGLIVNKEDEPQWISLTNNIFSLEKNTISMTIDTTTSNVNSLVSIQSTEYEAYWKRKRFKDDTVRAKKYYGDQIGQIIKSNTTGYKKNNRPFSLNFKAYHEPEQLGNNIVVKPFLDLPLSQNNLTQKKRSYPIDFVYPWEDQYESTLVLPENYTLNELPERLQIDNELAEINLSYIFTEGTLTSKGNYKFKKATYVASEYARIKHYFDQIVKYFNQPVVLVKKP